MMFFALQKLLNFRRSHLLVIDLSACTAGVLLRKLSPVQVCSRLFPTFSSICSISGFIVRSLFHLDLSFVQGVDTDLLEFFYILTSSLDEHHLLKMLSFFPLYLLLYQKSAMRMHLDLHLVLRFRSIDQTVCFYANTANTMQLSILWICSTAWNQGWWYLHKFFY